MRKRKNGEPQVVHRRCEAEYLHAGEVRRCLYNTEPGTPYCHRHQEEN